MIRFLAMNLAKFYRDELENYGKFTFAHPECRFLPAPQSENAHQCIICNAEILNFYAFCSACTNLNKNQKEPVITCLNCYEVPSFTISLLTIIGTYKKLFESNYKAFDLLQTF